VPGDRRRLRGADAPAALDTGCRAAPGATSRRSGRHSRHTAPPALVVAAPGLAPEPCGSGPAPDRGIGPAGPLRRVCLDQHGGARCLDVSHTAADQSRACNLEEALGPHLQEVRGRAPEPYTARGAEPDPGIAGVRIQRGEQSGLCSPCSRADRRYRDVLPTCREGQSYADSVHAILVGPICAD
jgi:hypothetical protein